MICRDFAVIRGACIDCMWRAQDGCLDSLLNSTRTTQVSRLRKNLRPFLCY